MEQKIYSEFRKHKFDQTWVSPRVKRALPCARGSNPQRELIVRNSSGLLPSLLFPP